MSEHKYAELAGKLREDIRTGKYTTGQKLPSENKLTALTGYSRQTVRQAMGVLKDEGYVTKSQGSGTYVCSLVPKHKATRNIAVITTYIQEYIFPNILHGIDDVLSMSGYSYMLSATRNQVGNERRILTELLQKPIDGLIVEGTKTAIPNPNLDLYGRFFEQGLPIVFMHNYYPDLKNPLYVVADDRAGGRIACELLLQKGHRRIAGIFKSDDMQGHRRYIGYVDALYGAGLSVEDANVIWYTTETRDRILEIYATEALRGCTAVVCYNDEVALQVINTMQANGLFIPEDMEIASFDNSSVAQLSATPFLSLISPKENLGRLAAEKLLNCISGEAETSTVLPWSLEHSQR